MAYLLCWRCSHQKVRHSKTASTLSQNSLPHAEEVVTTERAASIAAHMTTEYSTKTQLLSLDAHQKLLPLITGADPDTQKHSLTALCQLAELHQARQAIAQEGGT